MFIRGCCCGGGILSHAGDMYYGKGVLATHFSLCVDGSESDGKGALAAHSSQFTVC